MTILTRNKVTNAGAELINTTIGGKNKISYTTAELYNKDISKLSDDQLAATTSIGTAVISGKCNVLNVTGTTVSIGSTIANGDLTADITFCTVGWFATTSVDQANGKPPVLIAISQLDAPTTLAHGGTNGKATAYFLPKLNIGIANTTQIKLDPTEAGLITVTELRQALLDLSHSGLIDLGNKLPNGMEINKLHNTSLQYITKGSVIGLPPLDDKKDEDKDNDDSDRGGYLMSLGNNTLTQDGVQIYFNPYYNKTFVSFYNSKKNLWCDWIEVGSQSYTKEEIDKMIAKFATQGDLKDATKDLIEFITQFKAFNSSSVTTIKDDIINLDTDKSKQIGIIRFIDCILDAQNANSNVSFNSIRENQNYLEKPLFDIYHELRKVSGWVINIPVDDSKKIVYQYVITGDIKIENDNFYFLKETRIFCRYIPIGISVAESSKYPLTEITIDPLTTATSATKASRLASAKMKGFYDYKDFPPERQLISHKTIDLDDITFLSDIGIKRFDKCNLKSAAMIPPYDQDMLMTNDLLGVNDGNRLSGWIILLPTNSDDHNTSNPINPLQIVICYDREIYDHPEINSNMEIYYRFFNTNNPKSTTNFFHKFVTKDDSLRVELRRKKFNFNNMKYTTEGETDLDQVMGNASNAKEIGLPAIFDLYYSTVNAAKAPFTFHGSSIPFSYKILSEKEAYANVSNLEIYQEIKCLGFIFYRTGRTLPDTTDYETNKADTYFDSWNLKGNYSPITEYRVNNTGSTDTAIFAFILPDNVSVDKVGYTEYSDYKFTQVPSKPFPQGTYYLMGGYNNGGPKSGTPGYLRSFLAGGWRLQLITYYTNGKTDNYIRSGDANAIGQWLKIGSM